MEGQGDVASAGQARAAKMGAAKEGESLLLPRGSWETTSQMEIDLIVL